MTTATRYTDYDPWAWLYNQSEAHLAIARIMPALDKLLFPHLPENGRILDLCCGTGQVSHQLTLRGYQVTGLDGSEKMLHYARKNAPQVQFVLDDARSFIFPSSFDATICTDSSLNHIMSLEDLKRVFQNTYATLKDGGLFLFDLGLEDRYHNIDITDGELQANYAWTVGETYDLESKTGTFTITLFQPIAPNVNSKKANSNSVSQRLKRFVYNRILRALRPAALHSFLDKNWQPSPITFSVRSYARAEVTEVLEAVGFSQVCTYNFQGKTTRPDETKYAYFSARKLESDRSHSPQTERK